MSVLVKLFGGGGKGGKQPTPQEAIQRLRETEEMLTKKQDHLEKKIEEELLTAKRNGTKNKRGKGESLSWRWETEENLADEFADICAHTHTYACISHTNTSCKDQCTFSSLSLCPAALQALKRKKRYEEQLTRIDGTLSTIEFQREALENANTNTEVLKNMGFAAKAMKKTHENMYEVLKPARLDLSIPTGCLYWSADQNNLLQMNKSDQQFGESAARFCSHGRGASGFALHVLVLFMSSRFLIPNPSSLKVYLCFWFTEEWTALMTWWQILQNNTKSLKKFQTQFPGRLVPESILMR